MRGDRGSGQRPQALAGAGVDLRVDDLPVGSVVGSLDGPEDRPAGAAGTGDAANLLKPALARGTLRTVAATTWAEYKKYFEKDPALARRFQLVKLEEPSPDDAVTIIRGLREKYEDAHGAGPEFYPCQ